MGCPLLATGHYAQVEQDSGSGRWLLKKALHPDKTRAMCFGPSPSSSWPPPASPLDALQRGDPHIALEQGLSAPGKATVRTSALSRTETMPPLFVTTPGNTIRQVTLSIPRQRSGPPPGHHPLYPGPAAGAGGILQPGPTVCNRAQPPGQHRHPWLQRRPVSPQPNCRTTQSHCHGAAGPAHPGDGQSTLPHDGAARHPGADRSGHRPAHLPEPQRAITPGQSVSFTRTTWYWAAA